LASYRIYIALNAFILDVDVTGKKEKEIEVMIRDIINSW
jgi:hypothetical protein